MFLRRTTNPSTNTLTVLYDRLLKRVSNVPDGLRISKDRIRDGYNKFSNVYSLMNLAQIRMYHTGGNSVITRLAGDDHFTNCIRMECQTTA